MSRRRELLDTMHGIRKEWVTGLCVINLPGVALANDYVRSIATIANATMAEAYLQNQHALDKFNISKNK